MPRASFRRSSSLRLLRIALLILLVALTIDTLSLLSTIHTAHQTAYRQPTYDQLTHPLAPNVRGHRVFITSIHWNNEKILRETWNAEVIDLITYFGPENVYISVFESGSWDDTKGALRELDEKLGELGVQRRIVLDEVTHVEVLERGPEEGEEGWIDVKGGNGDGDGERKRELRRIPYLAGLRNKALKPLEELEGNGTVFDKVLFLNDVAFTTYDVAHLLATRDGDYAAACSLDFSKPPAYYDTFALRDSLGHEAATSTFPYFRSRTSRNAILANEPVPVRSCWNGIVAFDAAPFYSDRASLADGMEGAEEIGEKEGTEGKEMIKRAGSTPGLRFRGVSDGLAMRHLEGSECCLVHVDNPLSTTRGVWVNPWARVGYSLAAYSQVHPDSAWWPGTGDMIRGVWWNRVVRWMTSPRIKEGIVRKRVESHGIESGQKEKGEVCLINEMQVLRGNGWAHV